MVTIPSEEQTTHRKDPSFWQAARSSLETLFAGGKYTPAEREELQQRHEKREALGQKTPTQNSVLPRASDNNQKPLALDTLWRKAMAAAAWVARSVLKAWPIQTIGQAPPDKGTNSDSPAEITGEAMEQAIKNQTGEMVTGKPSGFAQAANDPTVNDYQETLSEQDDLKAIMLRLAQLGENAPQELVDRAIEKLDESLNQNGPSEENVAYAALIHKIHDDRNADNSRVPA